MSPLRKAAEAVVFGDVWKQAELVAAIEAVAREHCRKIAEVARLYIKASHVCMSMRGSGSPYSDWAREQGEAEQELTVLCAAILDAKEEQPDANGKYIAACDPQTVLALLDEVERLRETVRLYKLRSECLHCGALLEQSEADKEHWRTCDEHPARAERDALQKRLDSAEVYNNALEEERKRIGLQLHEAKQEWAERCKRQEAGLRAAEAERDDLRKQLDEASDVVITSGIEIGTLQIRAEKAEAALAEARPWCDWCGRRDE